MSSFQSPRSKKGSKEYGRSSDRNSFTDSKDGCYNLRSHRSGKKINYSEMFEWEEETTSSLEDIESPHKKTKGTIYGKGDENRNRLNYKESFRGSRERRTVMRRSVVSSESDSADPVGEKERNNLVIAKSSSPFFSQLRMQSSSENVLCGKDEGRHLQEQNIINNDIIHVSDSLSPDSISSMFVKGEQDEDNAEDLPTYRRWSLRKKKPVCRDQSVIYGEDLYNIYTTDEEPVKEEKIYRSKNKRRRSNRLKGKRKPIYHKPIVFDDEVDEHANEDKDKVDSNGRRCERECQPLVSQSVPNQDNADDSETEIIDKGYFNVDSVNTTETLDDLAGLECQIQTLKEMVLWPILYPHLYEKCGVLPAKGVIFHGPPGTGKTMIVKALINTYIKTKSESQEAGKTSPKISFFMKNSSDIVSKWVGVAEKTLHKLFSDAKSSAPSIIFFDEIDGIAPSRNAKQDQSYTTLVSTLLNLMDGLGERGLVTIIGCTNRIDAIDPALRRPGRFDKELYFGMPNFKSRLQLLKLIVSRWEHAEEILNTHNFLNDLAKSTSGFCFADIKSLCTEAVSIAIRNKLEQLTSGFTALSTNDQNNVVVTANNLIEALDKTKSVTERYIEENSFYYKPPDDCSEDYDDQEICYRRKKMDSSKIIFNRLYNELDSIFIDGVGRGSFESRLFCGCSYYGILIEQYMKHIVSVDKHVHMFKLDFDLFLKGSSSQPGIYSVSDHVGNFINTMKMCLETESRSYIFDKEKKDMKEKVVLFISGVDDVLSLLSSENPLSLRLLIEFIKMNKRPESLDFGVRRKKHFILLGSSQREKRDLDDEVTSLFEGFDYFDTCSLFDGDDINPDDLKRKYTVLFGDRAHLLENIDWIVGISKGLSQECILDLVDFLIFRCHKDERHVSWKCIVEDYVDFKKKHSKTV